MNTALSTHPHPSPTHVQTIASASSAAMVLQELFDLSLIRPKAWGCLPVSIQQEIQHLDDWGDLLERLLEFKVLTGYQAGQIRSGKSRDLVLGNYRLLDYIGQGGMGTVYKAEHLYLPRVVAIKVLHEYPEQKSEFLQRFLNEIWAIAQLHHPNVVAAIDAGRVSDGSRDALLYYCAMEYIAGENIEGLVRTGGAFDPAKACDLIHQVAGALAEAHKHGLVHRDLKPSNILLTPEGQAKLLDFGLVRCFGRRVTQPGIMLGTIDYMAPEQAKDASSADIRADIYGLGATLYWCLTGRTPFPPDGSSIQTLLRRLTLPPPSIRSCRPELPAELDTLVARMMAVEPEERFQTPDAVLRALLPFLHGNQSVLAAMPLRDPAVPENASALTSRSIRILIVDDEAETRALCRMGLAAEGWDCDEAANGRAAWEAVHARPYDLILSDVDMPEMTGPELLRQIREARSFGQLKVILFSGRASPEEMSRLLAAGADDYLTKPLSLVQLQSRVRAALRLKEAQDRSDSLYRDLLRLNAELEQNVTAQGSALLKAQTALVLGMTELATLRNVETPSHLVRMQRYCRRLAEEASRMPAFETPISEPFTRALESCAPLHDIGKVILPDHILQKAGKLDAEERLIMQTHTTAGAEVLQRLGTQCGFAVAFLRMATQVARHHHERYDGAGYPDGLAGSDIPLAARILSIADVYDALRCRRSYRPPLAHAAALEMMKSSRGQFDPLLFEAFLKCSDEFQSILTETPE